MKKAGNGREKRKEEAGGRNMNISTEIFKAKNGAEENGKRI
jgi:hypothetical protein